MARTPLLRSIVRGLAEARRAESPETPPVHPISRRHFLTGAAAAVALPLATSATAQSTKRAPRIAIVGGGLSGLCAALVLADRGLSPIIFEASPRIGGRIRSETGHWTASQVSEWGGELIDTNHRTMHALADRYGLPLTDLLAAEPEGSTETYYAFGSHYSKHDADEDFRAIRKVLAADLHAAGYPTLYNRSKPGGRALDLMSVYEWIETRVPGGHASPLGTVLDLAYNIEYGAETDDQSSLNLLYLLAYQPGGPTEFHAFGVSDEKYHIAGGDEQLPRAIAQDLVERGVEVRTDWRMESIARTSSGRYALTFDAGGAQEVLADIVILTVPFAVLRDVDYSEAGFDERKDLAIRSLGSGRNGKLQLQFEERFWNRSGVWGTGNGSTYSDTGYQATWEPTRGVPGQPGILVCYTGGDVTGSLYQTDALAKIEGALGSGELRADADRFLQQIAPVFPIPEGVSALWNGRATGSVPHLSPYSRCSYPYWRVGQCQTIAGYEAVPQGNVLFAGDHCSQDFQGFMEGAASEGERAGKQLLKRLGVQ